MNAAPFAFSPLSRCNLPPHPHLAAHRPIGLLSVRTSPPPFRRPFPLSHKSPFPGFALSATSDALSVGPSCALTRTSFSANVLPTLPAPSFSSSSSSASHSYSCSGNSLPPARRRTLLHFLRPFSPPREPATLPSNPRPSASRHPFPPSRRSVGSFCRASPV